jgi:hypothetical protein
MLFFLITICVFSRYLHDSVSTNGYAEVALSLTEQRVCVLRVRILSTLYSRMRRCLTEIRSKLQPRNTDMNWHKDGTGRVA